VQALALANTLDNPCSGGEVEGLRLRLDGISRSSKLTSRSTAVVFAPKAGEISCSPRMRVAIRSPSVTRERKGRSRDFLFGHLNGAPPLVGERDAVLAHFARRRVAAGQRWIA